MNKGRAFLEREDDDGEDDGFVELDTSSFLGSFSVVIILSHLAIGTCFYMFAEEWEFRDSLYFCVVTLTTVGYGDMAPSSDISKVFTIFYILLGLSIVATCLGLLVGRVQAKIEACHAQEVSKLGLMLKMVGILVVTTLVGAAYVMVAEGWGVLDSVYWAVVTASSVGYGDIVSGNGPTHYFAIAYMLCSVGFFAVALGRFGSMIMEMEAEQKADEFVKRGVSEGMVREMDIDESGSIDRSEFLQYMLVRMGKCTQDDINKVLSMFDAFDEDHSGTIDTRDVLAVKERRRSTSRSMQYGTEPTAAAATAAAGRAGSSGALAKPLLATPSEVSVVVDEGAWGLGALPSAETSLSRRWLSWLPWAS
uniref:EF-hand domain-containing protein n=1 Tax=Haptolina ericina TaxID=156174 RepID=A0A7S3B5W2_9EUKA